MKKQELETLIENKVRMILKEDNGYFWRSDKHSINDLWDAKSNLESVYGSVEHRKDFHPELVDRIIKSLEHVKKSAKKFKSGTDPKDIPANYH